MSAQDQDSTRSKDVDLDDDELFGMIGRLGAATNAARDPNLDQPLRDMAQNTADDLAAQLSDIRKNSNP